MVVALLFMSASTEVITGCTGGAVHVRLPEVGEVCP